MSGPFWWLELSKSRFRISEVCFSASVWKSMVCWFMIWSHLSGLFDHLLYISFSLSLQRAACSHSRCHAETAAGPGGITSHLVLTHTLLTHFSPLCAHSPRVDVILASFCFSFILPYMWHLELQFALLSPLFCLAGWDVPDRASLCTVWAYEFFIIIIFVISVLFW